MVPLKYVLYQHQRSPVVEVLALVGNVLLQLRMYFPVNPWRLYALSSGGDEENLQPHVYTDGQSGETAPWESRKTVEKVKICRSD